MRSLAREFQLGGVTLFKRNIEAPEQVAELNHDLQLLSFELPLWVAVDQEGGRVARLHAPFTEWPPMATLGRSGDGKLAYRFAAALAEELKAVGITLDYAPVLDIHTNPRNPVIGDRALGDDAETVARLGAAVIRGLQENGVAACGKHFPGHGDTSIDSHLALPIVEHPPDRIRRVECVPFREAIRNDVAFMMTAHILVPALDEQEPATLSSTIVQGMLRGELGFEGVILSDDLEMKAVADHYDPKALVDGCLQADLDALLVCRSSDLRDEVLRRLERAPDARLEHPLRRMIALKQRYAGPREPCEDAADEPSAPPYAEHRALASRFA